MTAAPKTHDPIASARANYLLRGWFAEEGDPTILGRFDIERTRRALLPGQEPKLIEYTVLRTMPLSARNLADPETSTTPLKGHNKEELIARFPEAWKKFTAMNPNAPAAKAAPAPAAEPDYGQMPTTRTNIPWPGFTTDPVFGRLLDLNLNYLEYLAFASDTQCGHIGAEGKELRQKARDLLGLKPLTALKN